MKCVFCGKEIKSDDSFINLRMEGFIHSDCLIKMTREQEDYNELEKATFDFNLKTDDEYCFN